MSRSHSSPFDTASKNRIRRGDQNCRELEDGQWDRRTEYIGVVVKDGLEVCEIQRAGVDTLGGPGFGGGIINVDVGRVGLVGVQEVDGIIKLIEFIGSDWMNVYGTTSRLTWAR